MSVHGEMDGKKKAYRVHWIDRDGKRRRLRLSNRRDAIHVDSQIARIIGCQVADRPLDPESVKWLESISDSLHTRLEKTGLVGPRLPKASAREGYEPVTLLSFINGYIDGRKDAADNTVRNWRNSRDKLTIFFGAEAPIAAITAGDCDDWHQSLVNAGLADATISKAIKHSKQFFQYAVRKGYCTLNPFGHLKAKGERNESRKHFVDLPTIQRVLDACPSAEWRLIVALCRFGGLRCPSEVLSLKWEDISIDGSLMTVTSPKTKRYQKGHRVVPIFGDLRPYLEDAREVSPDSRYLVTGYRDATSNFRTQFTRILKRAGVKPWPKLFHNMRASRQQQLIDAGFSPYVVCSWMGNTVQVSADHYEQVTQEHIDRARDYGTAGADSGQTLSPGNGIQRKVVPFLPQNPLETPENPCFIGAEIPPRGVEPLSSD